MRNTPLYLGDDAQRTCREMNLRAIAARLGFMTGRGRNVTEPIGNISALIAAIADGELVITPKNQGDNSELAS